MTKTKKKVKSFIDNQFDFPLFAIIIILLALGVVMVISASAPSALAESGNSYTYAGKQFGFAIVGIIAMLAISKIDYRFYKRFYWIAYWASCGILFLVLIPGLGLTINGATRWINLFVLGQFQPSEITKIGLILFYAGYLSDHKSELRDFKKGFIKQVNYGKIY